MSLREQCETYQRELDQLQAITTSVHTKCAAFRSQAAVHQQAFVSIQISTPSVYVCVYLRMRYMCHMRVYLNL